MWYKQIRKEMSTTIKFILVRTKIDIVHPSDQLQQVSEKEINEFLANEDIEFEVKTSAKTGENVNYLFDRIAGKCHQ